MVFLGSTGVDIRLEYDRYRVSTALKELMIALGQFQSANGTYPTDLQELVPAFVAEIPADSFTGDALVYQQVSDGYVLYSLGPNLRDDGRDHDDIGVKLPATE